MGKNSINADRHYCSVEEAETQGGIKQWQVSRWDSRLAERKKYAEMLYGAAYTKAMASRPRDGPHMAGSSR